MRIRSSYWIGELLVWRLIYGVAIDLFLISLTGDGKQADAGDGGDGGSDGDGSGGGLSGGTSVLVFGVGDALGGDVGFSGAWGFMGGFLVGGGFLVCGGWSGFGGGVGLNWGWSGVSGRGGLAGDREGGVISNG